jgi:secreted trypsin-like serine protease
MRRSVLLFSIPILILASVRAEAITYGSPDGAGHPNVGALLAEFFTPGVKDIFCSGTLISPTVFLTAAHCTTPLQAEGLDAWVSFDAEVTAKSKLYHGTMHTNPGYTFRQDDPGDIAVIVLDRPVRGITPASLPSAGMLDRLFAEGTLLHQRFTAVGYGVHEPVRGGGPPVFPYDSLRWTAVSEYNALSDAWLRLSQVGPAGNGGTCYGDSGGPNFLGAGANETPIIAGLTITGDSMCLATNSTLRLDSPEARAFLGQFVTLP